MTASYFARVARSVGARDVAITPPSSPFRRTETGDPPPDGDWGGRSPKGPEGQPGGSPADPAGTAGPAARSAGSAASTRPGPNPQPNQGSPSVDRPGRIAFGPATGSPLTVRRTTRGGRTEAGLGASPARLPAGRLRDAVVGNGEAAGPPLSAANGDVAGARPPRPAVGTRAIASVTRRDGRAAADGGAPASAASPAPAARPSFQATSGAGGRPSAGRAPRPGPEPAPSVGAAPPRARSVSAETAHLVPGSRIPEPPRNPGRVPAEPTIRIGTIEVVVTPPPAVAPPAPAERRVAPSPSLGRLSRGYPTAFGLRQG